MILPAKHLPPERCISGIGAVIIAQLDEAQSVSETWVRTSRAFGGQPITFDWFVLALSWLYAAKAIDYDNRGLLTREARP
ncbi:ABC-three component system middle component 6 [Roseitranquillus sediminis]|uniref:ABC-three component system middle component 6 n=1 Tax=Roseitranquillus sediminis TaxID=2809051 RepID=UPI001D0C49D1|nr:ABC-three component system middle component 6 [Roseitranquillus sediminis]MBM9595059.1 hypothetical protein [Roseitranquillus sediminis]